MAPNSHKRDQLPPMAADSGERPIPQDSIRIDNKVYSAEEIVKFHPGGPVFVRAFAGRDATMAFTSYHGRRFPHSKAKVEKALEFEDPNVKVDHEADADYLELCERVFKVLPRHKWFAPWHYYLKATAIMIIGVSLEMYMHWTKSYTWYYAMAVGWFFALMGFNIHHDAAHGAMSKRPWVGRLWGLTINWTGVSRASWIHQHVVQHHVHTNDVNRDPAMMLAPLLRVNPSQPLKKHYFLQHLYFYFVPIAYGFLMHTGVMMALIRGKKLTKMPRLNDIHRVIDLFGMALFFIRWVVIPLYQVPAFSTMLSLAPMLGTFGGYYLFFFTLSHNFEGVMMIDDETEGSWLTKQIASSSNVCYDWLNWLNGGLNYQIEHHLFPRMHHGHFPTVAPVVREYCKEKGIPYVHFDTVTENTISTVKHLYHMGHTTVPKISKGL